MSFKPSDTFSSDIDLPRGPGRFILRYVLRRWAHFAGLAFFVIAAASAAVGVQYAIKLLVDAMAGPRDWAGVWPALLLILALVSSEAVLWRLTGWLCCRTTLGVGVDMRADLFRFLSGQSIRYFAERMAGSLGQRITATAGNFGALTNTFAWRVLPPIVDLCGAILLFAIIDWRMMLALAGSVVAVTATLILFGFWGRPLHRAYAEQHNIASGDLIDSISNMWAVKAFSARAREHSRLKKKFEVEASAQRASWMYTEYARVLHDLALVAITGAMLTWAVGLWTRGTVTAGDVVLVCTLTFRILQGSREMALSLVDMVQQIGFIDETLRVIGRPHGVADIHGAPVIQPAGGSISLRNVSFSYGGRHDAVHEISLEIPAGQKIGIVGASGAGKSTLLGLLQRLYDPDDGDILIDGQPIRYVTQDSLRTALAVVPQEITLFHQSISDNIRFGRPEASRDEILAAARAAHCEAFIGRFPEGYETIVGERGTALSGGQRQRIGIARAFLKDAPIIILDEATSALDTESEMEIQRSIVEQMRDRTVIAVAHRLSTLALFDRIVVMDAGRIVEDGRIRDLIARGGLFEAMWRKQASGVTLLPKAGEAA